MIGGSLILMAVALLARGAQGDELTSQNNEHLAKWLKKVPKADLNGDGILTASEVWKIRSAAYRSEQFQKIREAQKARLKAAKQAAASSAPAKAAQPAKPAIDKPKPDFADVPYGPHARNVLDFWQAKADRPTPLVVFIHGGGWMNGDKSLVEPVVVVECLKSGISVAAINYRFTTTDPLPAPHHDGARAIQFLRSQAKPWNIDPTRVAAYGGSAGAGITLWLAFKNDMADSASSDPVARQSTRLTCGATFGGQSTYDPHVIKEWIGEKAARHPVFNPAYNVKSYEELDNPKLQPLFDEVSAIKHLTADDPPVFMYYAEPNVPLSADVEIGQGMHHPIFGLKLKEAMDRLHIECVYLHYVDCDTDERLEMLKFFRRHFGMK
jgi:acetyl esterase